MTEKVAPASEAGQETLRENMAALYVAMIGELFGGYHPERHYMRGPGPKWRASHPETAADTGVRPS